MTTTAAGLPIVNPKPGDVVIACPKCKGTDSIIVATITCDAVREVFGRMVFVTLLHGHRRACQECPCVFSTRRNGQAYLQHPGSHPYMPQLRPEPEPEPDRTEPNERVARRPEPPFFLEPPDV